MSEKTPPPSLPTRKSNSRSPRSPDKTPLNKESPLEVPQILDMIFSNLSSHQVRQSVLPVCRQWQIIAQSHAFRFIEWNANGGSYNGNDSDDNSHDHISGNGQETSPTVDCLEYLGVAQRLVISAERRDPMWRNPFQWKSSFTPASWQALLEAITTTPHPLNLCELQVVCPIDLDSEAVELLRHFGNLLTKLRLEVSRRDGAVLDIILSLCPKLKQLTVEFSCTDEVFSQESYSGSWSPSVSQVVPVAHPSLRSLTLRRIVVDEKPLLRLVDMCLGLEDLVLDQVLGATDNEVEMRGGRAYLGTVFQSIANIRPGLKRFGFIPCVLTATTEVVQAMIVSLFSKATKWIFPASTIMDITEVCGWSNCFLDLHRLTMLTSLEILVRHSGMHTMSLGFSLHNYLCSPLLSRHLVQLKAPGVMIPLDCLDMEGVLDSTGGYRNPDPMSRSLMPDDILGTARTKVWKCRSLRTLHIQMQTPNGDIGSAASSRLVFGYISKVCPALEDLRLQKNHLDLSNDGGLCLLARLDHLRSLALPARDGMWESTPGLDWMANELSLGQLNRLQAFIDQSISEEVFNPVYRHYPLDYHAPAVPGNPTLRHTKVAFVHGRNANTGDDSDSGGRAMDANVSAGADTVPNYVTEGIDMRYLGQLQGVVEMCKHRISSRNITWWPRMEYLEITKMGRFPNLYAGTAERTHARVWEMRPDIEFWALWR